MTGECGGFKSLQRSVGGNIWCILEWNLSFHIPTAYCGTLKNDVALNAN